MKIEEVLKKWFENNNINESEIRDIKLLKEAFLAGYMQAVEDKEKISLIFNK